MKKMMRRIHRILVKVLFGALAIGAIGCTDGLATGNLSDGDLLFVVNGHGNNITIVTSGVDGLGIDHVAVYSQGNIIEAIPEYGVVEHPLDSFMLRLGDGESVLVGRIDGLDVGASVENARRLLGRPDDDIFMPSDSAVYCSELVQKSFVFMDRYGGGKGEGEGKGKGEAADVDTSGIGSKRFVFNTVPMSFHDSTGNVTEFWTKFYAARGLKVPEGEPGTNPGQLSRDPNVKILGILAATVHQKAQ